MKNLFKSLTLVFALTAFTAFIAQTQSVYEQLKEGKKLTRLAISILQIIIITAGYSYNEIGAPENGIN